MTRMKRVKNALHRSHDKSLLKQLGFWEKKLRLKEGFPAALHSNLRGCAELRTFGRGYMPKQEGERL